MAKKRKNRTKGTKGRVYAGNSGGKKRQSGVPTISVCMIVRNEEGHIDRCLTSVKKVADEIIIVDTGSKDRTVSIAQKYTDKIYFHPWNNSFSEARNHYLKYAKGEWIFQIDADEELVQEDIPILIKAIQDKGIDAIMVQILSRFKDGKSKGIHSAERIFRNNGVIHYEGRVHNRLIGVSNARVFPIRLIHYGYDLGQGELRKKFHRTLSLLKMDLHDNPSDPLTHHYLSCSYMAQGLWREALDTALNAIQLSETKNDRNLIYLWSHYNAAMSYYRLGKHDEAKHTCLSALKKFPDHIDSHFLLALISFDKRQWAELIEHGTKYIRLVDYLNSSPERFGSLVTNSAGEKWNIQVLVGMGYFELQQIQKAHEFFEEAIGNAPEPLIVLRAIGIYLRNKGLPEVALPFLKRAQKEGPKDLTIKKLLQEANRHMKPAQCESLTISCCMIVRNEEVFIEQCLESVKDHVDEIVIVDTGSEDKTVEIARRYTDKVYFHPWEGNFSKARNQAISYATCDWIFQIDADEELLPDSGPRLREAVHNAGEADVILVNIISTYSNGKRRARHNFERLFKNNGRIHYEGIVHNRVVGGTCLKPSRIEIMHYGYDVDEKKAHEKFLRTTGLLKKQIGEEPNNPMPHHYLAASYFARGMIKEALSEANKAIELTERHNDKNPLYLWTHHIAALSYYKLGDLDSAERLSLAALNKFEKHLDSHYVLALVFAEKNKWDRVINHGETYLQLQEYFENNPDQAGIVINCAMSETATVNMLIGHAFYYSGEIEAMERHYKSALEASDSKWEVLWNIGCFHLDKSGNVDLAEKYLSLAKDENLDEPKIWYTLAKLNMKKDELENELNCLRRAVELGIDEINAYNRLGLLEFSRDNKEKAQKVLSKALDLAPHNPVALLYLGIISKEAGNVTDALDYLTKCIKLDPSLGEAWQNLGEISLGLGNLEGAKIFLERAIALMSSPVEPLLDLALLKLREDNLLELVKICDKLLKSLGLERNLTLRNMSDLVHVLLEIQFALRDDAKLANKANKLVKVLTSHLEAPLEEPTPSICVPGNPKADFMKQKIGELNARHNSP